jgi:hypothetical protein
MKINKNGGRGLDKKSIMMMNKIINREITIDLLIIFILTKNIEDN